MPYLLGIDLGTTFTAAAVLRLRGGEASGEPEMVALGDRGVEMPSVLFAAADGELLLGDAAQRRAVGEPDRVAREFKRRIGDPTPVSLGGRTFPAQDLAALLVRHVVDVASAREGAAPDRIALTHPASWGAHKKELLGGALAAHGLTVTFLAEPNAAALCHTRGERVAAGSTIAVYDLGGGTFDAAVVRKDAARDVGTGFTLMGRPEGVEYLGGVDFDEAVFEHVRAGAPAAFADLDESDPDVWTAVARVRRDCSDAKEALSSDTEASVVVRSPAGCTSVRLHRSEFEELIRPRVEDSVAALRRAVSSAGLEPTGLTSVLLVGGSSRIPLVAQLVSAQLDRPVSVDADPKNAIAKGAALALAPQPLSSWPGVDVPVYPGAGSADPAHPGRPETGSPETGRLDTGPIRPAPVRTPDAVPPTAVVPVSAPAEDAPTERFATWPPPTERFASWSPTRSAPVRPAGADTLLTRDTAPPSDLRARLLIGAGGLAGALAIVGAVLFWPTSPAPSSSGVTAAPSTGGASTSAAPRAVAPVAEPADAPAAEPGTPATTAAPRSPAAPVPPGPDPLATRRAADAKAAADATAAAQAADRAAAEKAAADRAAADEAARKAAADEAARQAAAEKAAAEKAAADEAAEKAAAEEAAADAAAGTAPPPAG